MNNRAPSRLARPSNARAAGERRAARLSRMTAASVVGAAFAIASLASAARDATPTFEVSGTTAVFADITRGEVTLNIDVAARRATVTARLEIEIDRADGGAPLLDVVSPNARFVTVDGTQRSELAEVTSPDGTSIMRMVAATLDPGPHTLDFETYTLREGRDARTRTSLEGISFVDGSFEFQSDQDDTKPRHFTERFFPSGFERDSYPFKVTVNVENARGGQIPDVMTNGAKTILSEGRSFEITFPDHYNTSAWFLHVIDRSKFAFATGEYESSDGRIVPLTAYGRGQNEVDVAIEDTKHYLAELEADYGPYPHEFFLVAINTTRNDAEEYGGAAQTSFNIERENRDYRGALGHELLHMWFGRSARPYEGRDGWVDESIASWRDDGYDRSPRRIELDAEYSPLAYQSRWRRDTPGASYDQGAEFAADVDRLLASRGGLKPVLREFHARFAHRSFTTEDYLALLREMAPDREKLEELIEAKVYAGARPHHQGGGSTGAAAVSAQ